MTTADSPAVYTVITGSSIVRVNLSFVIDIVRITRTTAVCVEPGTGIGVHGIVTNTKAVTIANIVFQGIIGFTRKVRFTEIICAEPTGILTVITLSILQITVRVDVKNIRRNGI